MNQEQHEMILDKTHPSGVDEWYCPTCGRRLLMAYEPNFKKTVLDAGDEYAVHSGGKGGLRIGTVQISQNNNEQGVPPSAESAGEDPYLAPWRRWLDQVDLDDSWNSEV